MDLNLEHGARFRATRASRKPFEILPVCGKYQDYLLEDAPRVYYALFREMAHLAAWDHQGRYDDFFGPLKRYSAEEGRRMLEERKPQKLKKMEVLRNGCGTVLEKGIDFAVNVASQIFTPKGKDPETWPKLGDEHIL